jgi:serine/threonine-protein kinase RsbW
MVLKSEIQNINLIEKLIDELSLKYHLNSDVYGKLLVAVVEGVNNAIVHGNKMIVEKDIIVDYTVNSDKIEFFITDSGAGFDYKNIPDPTKSENKEKTHGRGIFLMRKLADEIEYTEPGNKVKMVFYLNK